MQYRYIGFYLKKLDIKDAWSQGKIASFIGVEGGHAIDSR